MSNETDMTITEILVFAETEGFDVYKLAHITGPNRNRYEVQFDYGDANVSYWATHEEARREAARLWNAGLASQIDDHVVLAAARRMAERGDGFSHVVAPEGFFQDPDDGLIY